MTALAASTGRWRTRRASGAVALSGILAIVILWEMAARALTGAYVLAAPSEVIVYLIEHRALLARNLAITLENAALGFVIGNLSAILLAMAALVWPRSERVITSLALLVFCLPLVATGPILRVFFGPGPWPQIALAALAVYYTTLIPLLVGLRAAPASWFDLVRSYGRGEAATLFHVRTMASLPYLFAGLQIAAPAAFLGAMVGEFTGAEAGMGVLTIRAMRSLDVEMTWALATLATLVALLAYAAIGLLARRILLDAPPVILAAPDAGTVRRRGGRVAEIVITSVVALTIWWAGLTLLDLNAFFAKRPGDVIEALLFAPDAAATRSTLTGALAETSLFLLPGYLAGLAVGAALAVVFTILPMVSAVAMPVALALRSVPIVTTAPLVVLILGRGATGTIVLVAIMVFFPTLVACLHGLRQAPGQILDVFDSYGAGRIRRLVQVRIPAMLPALFAAARMGVPASVLAVTVVEWLATGKGIGSLMAMSASLSDYDMLWSAVVIVSILSALGYAAVGWLERRVLEVYAPEQLA